jgi:fucose permease
VVGLPDGLLGVAWPQMRRAHHQPASALAVLLLCGTGAYFASSALSGAATHRYRTTPLLGCAATCAAAGALVVATSAGFPMAVLGVVLLSAGAGLIDPLFTTIASMGGNAGLVSLMHGVYAVGASSAPLMIAASASPSTWRFAYAAVGAGFALVLAGWTARSARATPAPARQHAPNARGTLPRASGAVLALAAFFGMNGLEIAAGAWAAVYLTDALSATPRAAAWGALAYWCALSVARLSAGIGAARRPDRWTAAGCLAAVAGCTLLCLSSTTAPAVVALTLLGAGVGPLLPMLTVLTPNRVRREAVARMIGWQMAAAAVGSALVSSGVGLVVHRAGVPAIGPTLTLVAVFTAVVIAALQRRTRRDSARGSTARR